MKKVWLLIVLCAGILSASAQTPAAYDSLQNLKARSGYGFVDGNGRFKNSFGLPYDTIPMKVADSNFIALNNGVFYRWTGHYWLPVGGGSGGGSLSIFTAGSLSPLFSTNVANPTTAPALSFTLSNAAPFSILGNNTGFPTPPTYVAADSSIVYDLHSEGYYNLKYGKKWVANLPFQIIDGATDPDTLFQNVASDVNDGYMSAADHVNLGNTWRYNGNAPSALKWFGTTNSLPVPFRVNSAEIMRLTSTGMGIFNTNPLYPLDVTGNIRYTDVLYDTYGSILHHGHYNQSTYLGYLSGTTATAADQDNSGFGASAFKLMDGSGATNSLAGGVSAGYSFKVGTRAVFLGRNAGVFMNNVSDIVMLGSQPGGGDNYTGSNLIKIGGSTTLPSLSAWYQLNIGNWIYGRGGKITIGGYADSTRQFNVTGTTGISDTLFNAGNKYNGTSAAQTMVTYDTLTKAYHHQPIPASGSSYSAGSGLGLSGTIFNIGGTLTSSPVFYGANLYGTSFSNHTSFDISDIDGNNRFSMAATGLMHTKLSSASRAGRQSFLSIRPDSIFMEPSLGNLFIDSLNYSSGSADSMMVWNKPTGKVGMRATPTVFVSGTNLKTVNGSSLLGSGDIGTFDVAHGGTGNTSLTANYIPYGNGTSAFQSSANLTYDGSLLTGLSAGLGQTQTDTKGLLLTNTTAAAAGTQQYSPALHFNGRGWKTTSTAASQAVDARQYLLGVQGTTNPSGKWQLEFAINGGSYTERFGVNSFGSIYLSGAPGSAGQVPVSNGFASAAGWLNLSTIATTGLTDGSGTRASGTSVNLTGPLTVAMDVDGTGSGLNILFHAGTTGFTTDYSNHLTQMGDVTNAGNQNKITVNDLSNIAYYVNNTEPSTVKFGINTPTPNSTLNSIGSVAFGYTKVEVNEYNATATDYTLSVNNAESNWDIYLPDPTTCLGRIYIIKRFNNTSTGRVSINRTSGNVQDPVTGEFVTNFALGDWGTWNEYAKVQSNGSDWETIK